LPRGIGAAAAARSRLTITPLSDIGNDRGIAWGFAVDGSIGIKSDLRRTCAGPNFINGKIVRIERLDRDGL
jgi:hypothetical protein